MISRSVVLCVAVVAAVATAFSPSEPPTRATRWSAKTSTYAPMKRVSGLAAPPPSSLSRSRCISGGLCMSSDPEAEAAKLREQAQKLREEAAEAAGVSVQELTSGDGTVYDDEMLEPPRENVSSAMKERLIREASTGLDSNKSQPNVILYISVAVALLVLVGGQGVLY
eukprot:CAMPEP_0172553124 /NCGR_PEP_ID=MMETSP1067-20121228/48629_1 /TAXON_ID=265564 ORGANISM="Thalassiosira punctigera, Strain Tpunct2005C2" /NCGR_SAMPLE_ID=MMETSP1067 /ASSEMBLY_ACC=CAM_ASM_000444 /LENGTH=167 /DNA_ID=CAMNT_0013341241 /DNA_START=129 /DNA_END=632 /DNA_ORIENTATION=+